MATYTVCENCQKVNRLPIPAVDGREPICGQCQKALPISDGVSSLSARSLTRLVHASPLPVVVDFWAPWCGPCRVFAPTFQQAATRLGGKAVLAKVDTEAHPAAAEAHAIRSIPTLIAFRDGREIARQSGALSAEALARWLEPFVR